MRHGAVFGGCGVEVTESPGADGELRGPIEGDRATPPSLQRGNRSTDGHPATDIQERMAVQGLHRRPNNVLVRKGGPGDPPGCQTTPPYGVGTRATHVSVDRPREREAA